MENISNAHVGEEYGNNPTTTNEPLISKNQLKKALKRQRKEEYWATKKQEKKEEKRQRNESENKLSSTPSESESNDKSSNHPTIMSNRNESAIAKKQSKKSNQLEEFIRKCNQNFNVIIDCAFEDIHTEKAFKSMCQQVMFCYGFNRTHSHPVHIYVTGSSIHQSKETFNNLPTIATSSSLETIQNEFINESTASNTLVNPSKGHSLSSEKTTQKVFQHLAKCSSHNWVAFHEHAESYLALPQFTIERQNSSSSSSSCSLINNSDSSLINNSCSDTITSSDTKNQNANSATTTDHSSITATKQLVYLTSDATETLETLDPNCAYIIGGIVDRNSHKGITYEKAMTQGIRCAKLPIKEHVRMAATHVLTINHVFEILLTYSATQSWSESLKSVLPERKEFEAKS